jgi:hypothetical protein
VAVAGLLAVREPATSKFVVSGTERRNDLAPFSRLFSDEDEGER